MILLSQKNPTLCTSDSRKKRINRKEGAYLRHLLLLLGHLLHPSASHISMDLRPQVAPHVCWGTVLPTKVPGFPSVVDMLLLLHHSSQPRKKGVVMPSLDDKLSLHITLITSHEKHQEYETEQRRFYNQFKEIECPPYLAKTPPGGLRLAGGSSSLPPEDRRTLRCSPRWLCGQERI